MTALRWLLVLPVAILMGFLLTYPSHLLIFMAGEIAAAGKRLAVLDRPLMDLAWSLGFVYFGARTAPNHRPGTAVFLAVFLTVVLLAARIAGQVYFPKEAALTDNWDPLSISMGLAGAALGVIGALKLEEPKGTPRPKAKAAKSVRKPSKNGSRKRGSGRASNSR
jgi:hypothetical protein